MVGLIIWGDTFRRSRRKCIVIMISIIMLVMMLFPMAVKSSESDIVRVGYYEQEVFQEGASDGQVKTGYAYEYYQKPVEPDRLYQTLEELIWEAEQKK